MWNVLHNRLHFVAIYICLKLHWQDNIILTTITAITVIFSGSDTPLAFSIEHIVTALLGALCALAVNFLFTPTELTHEIL